MPSPRQRPLAWLFWIAAALWNVVALAANYESAWFDAVAAGQVLVASGWLVMGRGLPLARAALVAAALTASVAPDYLRTAGNDFFPLWQYVLGALLLVAASTAFTTTCWLMLHAAAKHAAPRERDWPRFSVADALGWTLIAAVLCAALPRAQWSHIDASESVVCGLLAMAAAGIMVGIVPTWGMRMWPRLLIAAAVLLSIALAAFIDRTILGPCAFVLAWAIVQRLETSPQPAPTETTSPLLRLASHSQ